MASVSPRVSGLWSGSRMSYFDVAAAQDGDLEGSGISSDDGRTPLDKTIDRIGMGSYQWTLLSLCGFGWMADNMWIQAMAIILPRVQQHFAVPDTFIGTLSASMFGGMMFGAVGWGTCSDLMGRTTAFNATLFLTAFFGILASFVESFFALCVTLFFLGSAVGGSMPTDGTLLLEHMPNGKQYLVTALSVFFSLGAVFAAIVGLLVIPGHSCPPAPALCDIKTQNSGWQYLLITLAIITLSMFLARIVFFRLHESPRYLVHAGRPHEAVESLQLISKFNGSEFSIGLHDVVDHVKTPLTTPSVHSPSPSSSTHADIGIPPPSDDPRAPFLQPTEIFSADTEGAARERPPRALAYQTSREVLRGSSEMDRKAYDATGESTVPLDAHTTATAAAAQTSTSPAEPSSRSSPSSFYAPPPPPLYVKDLEDVGDEENEGLRVGVRRGRRASSLEGMKRRVYWRMPRWVRKPLWAWMDRVGMVLAPEWMRTTLLVWGAWCSMSLAYTMFNVYLPKLLETRGGGMGVGADGSKNLESTLWDVVIYSIGGCPGAILGAWLIESPLGRRRSLAGSTFVTAAFCMLFVWVERPWAVRTSTVGISLSATAMWAVLYGWTPEIFGTKVRGTACGIASALSRIGGMIAPMLGGTLLTINSSFPVYASIVIFFVAGICVLLLKEDEEDRGTERVLMH